MINVFIHESLDIPPSVAYTKWHVEDVQVGNDETYSPSIKLNVWGVGSTVSSRAVKEPFHLKSGGLIITNERTNKQTNKQTRQIAIPPDEDYVTLAVSTRPTVGVVSALWASVRSFISIRQVAPNDLDLDLTKTFSGST